MQNYAHGVCKQCYQSSYSKTKRNVKIKDNSPSHCRNNINGQLHNQILLNQSHKVILIDFKNDFNNNEEPSQNLYKYDYNENESHGSSINMENNTNNIDGLFNFTNLIHFQSKLKENSSDEKSCSNSNYAY